MLCCFLALTVFASLFSFSGCNKNPRSPSEFSELTVNCGEASVKADFGTSSWSYPNEDGGSKHIESDGYNLTLKSGGYVYLVTARFDLGNNHGGTVRYCFYVIAE